MVLFFSIYHMVHTYLFIYIIMSISTCTNVDMFLLNHLQNWYYKKAVKLYRLNLLRILPIFPLQLP